MTRYLILDVFNPDRSILDVELPDKVVPIRWIDPFNPSKVSRRLPSGRKPKTAKVIPFPSRE